MFYEDLALHYALNAKERAYLAHDPTKIPAIVCADCLNTHFEITYGDKRCIAVCHCGNRIKIYST